MFNVNQILVKLRYVRNKSVPLSETYKVVRGQIEHLSNNLGQRVIWMVIAQSFFFSGYAILINGKPPGPELEPIHQAMIKLIPIAALLTVIFSFIDVIASILLMKKLRLNYEANEGESKTKTLQYPPVNASRAARIFIHASPVLIPILFIVIWIILLVVQYTPHATPPAMPGK